MKADKPESERTAAARLTIAMGYVVTRDMIRHWKKNGYCLTDLAKLKRSIRNQERLPRASDTVVDDDEVVVPVDPSAEIQPGQLSIDVELGALQAKLLRATDYNEARTIRTQIAGVKDVIKTLRDQDYYVTKESQLRRGILVGQTIKSLVLKIPSELPQMIIGLDYPDAMVKCEDYAYSILAELAEAELRS